MTHISFNPRFINDTSDDLILGKIHTIRHAYEFWKKQEGKRIALFKWEGKPYKSKHLIFCKKKIVSVQKVIKSEVADFWLSLKDKNPIPINTISKNDGFDNREEFIKWFAEKPYGEYGIIHFADFKY